MTELNAAPRRTWFPRPPIMAAATLAAFILAGCSSTHVGESWQCPLAQGGSCTSVEAADPAVPARGGEASGRVAGTSVPGDPLYRVRAEPESARAREPARAERPCDAACGPFAWLARLFGTDTDADGDESAAAKPAVRPGAEAETALPLPADTAPAPWRIPRPGDPPRRRSGRRSKRRRWNRPATILLTMIPRRTICARPRWSGASGSRPSSTATASTARGLTCAW